VSRFPRRRFLQGFAAGFAAVLFPWSRLRARKRRRTVHPAVLSTSVGFPAVRVITGGVGGLYSDSYGVGYA
jgi:hypothetical protein